MKRCTLFSLILIALSSSLFSREINEMEFINRPIRDIAFALSKAADINIIPDETIEGTTTFYFAGGTAEEAIDIFLTQNKLYIKELDNHTSLSRINLELDSEGLISIDADEVSSIYLLKKLSQDSQKTILFDALPPDLITLHVKELPIERILEIIIKKNDEYHLEVLDGYFYIKYTPQTRSRAAAAAVVEDLPEGMITERDGLYSLNIDQEGFKKLLMNYFRDNEKEFIFLGQNNSIIENLYIKDKSFEEALAIILEQGDSESRLIGDTYYIFDSQRRSIVENYYSSSIMKLKNIYPDDLMQLLPPSLTSKTTIKVDRKTKTIVLYGSVNDIDRVQAFITKMDNDIGSRQYARYELSFVDTEKLQSMMPESFKNIEIVTIPDSSGIVAYLAENQVEEFSSFLDLIDQPKNVYQIDLKYIKAEEFIKALPPSISKDDIVTTNDDRLLFFKGEEAKYRALQREMASIDRPIPQIRYDILVIQYFENKKFNWDMEAGNSVTKADGATSYLGKIGATLNIDFDVTNAFGYQWSLDLNTNISQSKAKIMADSTLNALSGEQARFRNTNTYRYRDTVKDKTTGNEEVQGVSREITSGLFITLNGWVSGDDMITMKVSTTISKQESASKNQDVGTLPPTSEKIIETNIRTPAGKPVVIGGLLQQELTQSVQKVPILGSIPLLGLLFQKRQENYENTEFVVYIIPYIEDDILSTSSSLSRINRLRNKYDEILGEEL